MHLNFFLSLLGLIMLNEAPVSASPAPVPARLEKRIPAAVYQAGQHTLAAQGTPIVILDNGVMAAFQISDSNFVIYVNGVAKWNSGSHVATCNAPNHCILAFQSDGNLVSYLNNVPTWASWTTGAGKWLVFFDIEPYIVIYNAAYQPVWHTPITPPAKPPVPEQVKKPGFAFGPAPVFTFTF